MTRQEQMELQWLRENYDDLNEEQQERYYHLLIMQRREQEEASQ